MSDILIVDDERDIRELISDILEDEGYSTRKAGNSDEAMNAINSDEPGLIILDIWLKDSRMDGIDILKKVKTDNPDVPIVIISGHGNIEIAVAAIKQGAYDFIEKPFNIDQLMVVIRRAMETSRLRRENQSLRRQDTNDAQMIGTSSAYRTLVAQLEKVTKSNGRVMLTGPAGSGKEVAARYIHANSNRAAGPFVTVNCAGVEPDRMEEVLFGRETAERGVEPGLLEQAHGGVVYFDEVADMPLGTQSKILRVLVDQQCLRVGGSDKVRVDLRVISSTNRDLDAAIGAGTFREELFHRLNVVPIAVPSLEERREDIPDLVDHFVRRYAAMHGKGVMKVSDRALAMIRSYDWPGNVRELANVVERGVILAGSEQTISFAHLFPHIAQASNAESVSGDSRAGTRGSALEIADAVLKENVGLQSFEEVLIARALERSGGNVSRAARLLGISRATLDYRLKRRQANG